MQVELIKRIGRKGVGDGEFNFPSGVAVLPNGDIIVTDLHNHRIQVHNSEKILSKYDFIIRNLALMMVNVAVT